MSASLLSCLMPRTSLLSLWRFLVVEKPGRDSFRAVREILRQRVERRGELQRFLRREVIWRDRRAFEDLDVREVSVAVNGEAHHEMALQSRLDDLGHDAEPVHTDAAH